MNDYNSAIDNGTSTSYTQTGLTINTAYTLYVWAYNNCEISPADTLTQSTSNGQNNWSVYHHYWGDNFIPNPYFPLEYANLCDVIKDSIFYYPPSMVPSNYYGSDLDCKDTICVGNEFVFKPGFVIQNY